jgi:hypothetical protein
LMVASRSGDRIGHRRVVLAALTLFAAASALGALAQSVWVLATARALQGTAAAASVPAALRLLTTVVPDGPAGRRAVAGWSAAGAAAGASGFVVGGVLTELASWRAVFWMNIGLAALLAGAIARLVVRDQPRAEVARIGWPSATLLSALLVTFSVVVVIGSLCPPRLIAALDGGRALGCGLGIIAAGNTVLVVWPNVMGVGAGAATCGLRIGIGSVAATDMGTAVAEAIKGTAAGVLNTAAQLGTAIGTALVLLVATTFQPRTAWALPPFLPVSQRRPLR